MENKNKSTYVKRSEHTKRRINVTKYLDLDLLFVDKLEKNNKSIRFSMQQLAMLSR